MKPVPDFCNLYPEPEETWVIETNKWLRQFGLALIVINYNLADDITIKEYLKDCFVIASGPNEYGVNHAVIWWNGKIVHNPNEMCKGIKIKTIDIILACDPAQFILGSSCYANKS